jgi:hypothetical protein
MSLENHYIASIFGKIENKAQASPVDIKGITYRIESSESMVLLNWIINHYEKNTGYTEKIDRQSIIRDIVLYLMDEFKPNFLQSYKIVDFMNDMFKQFVQNMLFQINILNTINNKPIDTLFTGEFKK